MSNVFEIIKMNGPAPLEVIENCIQSIDCVTDVDNLLDRNDIVCLEQYKHYQFTLKNKIKFTIRYNDMAERTEVEIVADAEHYKQHIAYLKSYPQYQNKSDEYCAPSKYVLTHMLDDIGYVSLAYEEIEEVVPKSIRDSLMSD